MVNNIKATDTKVIAYTQATTAASEDIKMPAAKAITEAMEDAAYSQTGDDLLCGSRLGLELIKERDDFNENVARLDARLDKLQEGYNQLKTSNDQLQQQVDWLQNSNDLLQQQVRTLSSACNGYLSIRQCFLETTLRDKLGVDYGSKRIRAGNAAAHHGDVLTDATLYERSLRSDKGTFGAIYGISYCDVLKLEQAGDTDSITILNKRATLLANDPDVPEKIEAAFRAFILLLENNLGQSPTNALSPLGQAYLKFWDACQTHNL
ncbi:hypothetical protein FQN50_005994 [Emmonsiellopsis sp. PD_5]|nr:hypothetical protein FQN50_005994 [Emmonsiellopsis sp. PD_5]